MNGKDTLLEREDRRDNNDSGFLFFCYEMPYYGDNVEMVPPHWHNHIEIAYTEAYGTMYINDKTYEMTPGDVFFINPGSIHRTYRKTAGLMIHIVFDIALLKISDTVNPCNTVINEISLQNKKIREKVDRNNEHYDEILLHTSNIIKTYRERPASFGAESYDVLSSLFGIMSAIYRADMIEGVSGENIYGMRYVAESINYIDEHYGENITVSDLAKNASVSETYMYRLFRDYVGTTPINYINSVRLRASYRLLLDGVSVTDTAVTVGVPSVSYFIKLFKGATGVTPKAWVSARRNNNDGKRRAEGR